MNTTTAFSSTLSNSGSQLNGSNTEKNRKCDMERNDDDAAAAKSLENLLAYQY
jgi:hypothetical protein